MSVFQQNDGRVTTAATPSPTPAAAIPDEGEVLALRLGTIGNLEIKDDRTVADAMNLLRAQSAEIARHRLAATPAEPDEVTSEMIEAVAAAIYAEDDVWSQAIPFDKLDELDQAAYRRIAAAAMRAARHAASRSGGA